MRYTGVEGWGNTKPKVCREGEGQNAKQKELTFTEQYLCLEQTSSTKLDKASVPT